MSRHVYSYAPTHVYWYMCVITGTFYADFNVYLSKHNGDSYYGDSAEFMQVA